MKSADYKNNGEITNIQIGDALKKIRREKGLTQKQAASEMGVSQTYISAVEQGKRTARTDFVIKLIKFYGVSYESVFGKNENDEKKKVRYEEPLRLFLEGTGLEDSADVYLDLCRYLLIRILYKLNPHNSDRVFSLPEKYAVEAAGEQIRKSIENLMDYLKRSGSKCKNLGMPIEYNQLLIDIINNTEKLLK